MAVATILVTGTFQGWREVRSTAALTGTTYGRLLMIKFGLFALMVALGALSRRFVQARYQVPATRLSFGPGAATADAEARRSPACGAPSGRRRSSLLSCWPSPPSW